MRSLLLSLLLLSILVLTGCSQIWNGSTRAAETTASTPNPTEEDNDQASIGLITWDADSPEPTPTYTPLPTVMRVAPARPTATPTAAPTETPKPTEPPAADSELQGDRPDPTATVEEEPTPPPAANSGDPGDSIANSAVDRSAFRPSDPSRIVIEDIDMDLSLMSVGLDANRVPIVPNHDAAWYNLSAQPGNGENVVLWGHVLRFKHAPNIPAPFARVRELNIGMPITIYNASGQAFNYTVAAQIWALPGEVEYILPQGSERLTLVSCIGNEVIVDGSLEMTHRLITIATPAE